MPNPQIESPSQRGDGQPTDYQTYRTMQPGPVSMRLRDVTAYRQWSNCWFTVRLVDYQGRVVSTGRLDKAWGANTPYIQIANFSQTRTVRMQISATVAAGNGNGTWEYLWHSFKGDLLYS